jgi:hypothetical protein
MVSVLKVGNKIWLKSCDNSARDIHPHIWRLDSSTRSSTILNSSYEEPSSGKVFVCLSLENPINSKPSSTEQRYLLNESSSMVPTESSRIMLVERRMLMDESVKFTWRKEESDVWREPDMKISSSIMQETESAIDEASVELLSNVLGLSRPDASKLLGVFGSVEDALDNYDAYMESEDALLSSELANVFSFLPDVPSDTTSTSAPTIYSSLPPPLPPPLSPPPTSIPPIKPEKPSLLGGLFGLSKKRPHPMPPPPPPHVDGHQDEIDQLVGILSVTPKVAKHLLEKHKHDVTETITHYFGLSNREQTALAQEDKSFSSSGMEACNSDEGEEWDSFESFLSDSDARGHGSTSCRGNEQPLRCGGCEEAVHYLPPNLYSK